MQAFEDSSGNSWEIVVNVTAVKRVRAALEVDLLDIVGGDLVKKLSTDPVLLCDILATLCKPQIEKAGKTEEDFGEGLAGDAIDRATKALLEELINFSQRPADRANLRKALEITWTAIDKANELIAGELASGKIQQNIDLELRKLGLLSTDSPESSD